MTQSINQFSQTAERGQVALLNGANPAISVMIDASVTATLKSGDAVKIVATSKGLPKVIPTTAVDDVADGFIMFNPVKNEFTGNDRCEMLFTGGFMYMIAGAATPAKSKVQYNPDNGYVGVAAADANMVGIAVDTASAVGDLIRVKIKSAF
ncbi:hypothetical protein AAIR98_000899 [Elusimicrobium simillimum]|uniref:hypothetical protein n=1 Tax=Elusimicrobium simillimum TaxID=3143438 RepID=UPI003C6FC636